MSLTAAINVSVISDDPIFINQIKIYSQNLSIKFSFLKKLWTESPTDLFLIDADLLGNFLKKNANRSTIKFIACGKQKDLKPAFDAGCIDYLKTPFDMDEFEIRLLNILNSKLNTMKWKSITLGQDAVESKDMSVKISIEEHTILKMLIQNLGEPVPREAFYFVLPGNHKKDSRVVDMHISNLRKKIQQLRVKSESECGYIKTVRGYGYIVY